jgi:hypothetical protein
MMGRIIVSGKNAWREGGSNITGGWGTLHTEELYNLSSAANGRVIKSRTARWARNVISV